MNFTETKRKRTNFKTFKAARSIKMVSYTPTTNFVFYPILISYLKDTFNISSLFISHYMHVI